MNRRDFLKAAIGSMTLFLSGCGVNAVAENQNQNEIKNISGGDILKIVVITGSPHSDDSSTSKFLAQKFIEGAQSKGHEIFTFDADKEDTHPCKGCDSCGMNGPCIFKDAIETKLMPKMLESDLIVLVSPLYYFGMSAQLKIIVDRFYSRTTKLNGKKSIMMATAWNSADWTFEALQNHYETLVRYMNWSDVGQIWATGCGVRSLVERSEFAQTAFNLGANL